MKGEGGGWVGQPNRWPCPFDQNLRNKGAKWVKFQSFFGQNLIKLVRTENIYP